MTVILVMVMRVAMETLVIILVAAAVVVVYIVVGDVVHGR